MNQIATYVALGLVALFFAFVACVLIWRARTARLSLSVPEGKILPDAVEAVLGPLMDITQTYRDRDFKWHIEAHVDCKMILSTGRRLIFQLAP